MFLAQPTNLLVVINKKCQPNKSMSRSSTKASFRIFMEVFVIATAILLLLDFQNLPSGASIYAAGLSGLGTALLWTGNGVLVDLLSARFSWIEAPVKRLVISAIVTLVYTFLIWWLIATAWQMPQKGFDLGRPLTHFKWADFFPTLLITLFISIFMHGRGFLLEWKQAAAEAERLKKEQIAARYETLKNQVNPHFLFNSLNVLTTLVHKDAHLAEQFIRQLSAVYRYILDSRDREAIPLAEELAALHAYIFLMKIRFGDSFNARIRIASEDGKVAPLTLQMLLENALKHNEVSKNNPLLIEILEEGDYIIVQNNVQPKTGISDFSGVGLANIQARYQFLTDKKVIIIQEEQRFTVKIPILQTS